MHQHHATGTARYTCHQRRRTGAAGRTDAGSRIGRTDSTGSNRRAGAASPAGRGGFTGPAGRTGRKQRTVLRTVLLTGVAATAAALTTTGPASADTSSSGGAASTADAAVHQYKSPLRAGSRRMSRSLRMEQRFAEWSLRSNGIRWRSSGGCADREREICTSFDQIRWGSVDGLIDFKEDSGCPLVISGGTEQGHAQGPYSHWNGYKIDIMPTPCTDARIHRFRALGTRGDGAELYRSPTDAVFARESDHWDITFR